MKPMFKRFLAWLRNTDGSASVEMLGSVAVVCVIIVNCMMILGYALQQNQVSYAAKRVARSIEISGYISESLEEENDMLKELLPNADELEAQVMDDTISTVNVWARDSSAGRTRLLLQLREMEQDTSTYTNPSDFTLHVQAFYTLPLAYFGAEPSDQESALDEDAATPSIQLKLPINVYVNGQSEIYWKSNANWSRVREGKYNAKTSDKAQAPRQYDHHRRRRDLCHHYFLLDVHGASAVLRRTVQRRSALPARGQRMPRILHGRPPPRRRLQLPLC